MRWSTAGISKSGPAEGRTAARPHGAAAHIAPEWIAAVFVSAATLSLLPAGRLLAGPPDVLATIQAPINGTTFGAGLIPLGDQNDDGYDDFLVYSGEWQLLMFYGGHPLDISADLTFESLVPWAANVGDVNGDGYDDLGSAVHLGKRLCVFYGGPAIDTEADLIFGSDSLYACGPCILGDDISQDGVDEIIAQEYWQISLLFYDLGGSADSVADLVLTPANKEKLVGAYTFGRNICGGDFNGDSKRDIAVSYTPDGQSDSVGAIYLYWGSPEFDTIPDMVIPRPNEWLLGTLDFSRLLVNIGDFNADGYEDLLAGTARSSDDTTSFIFFGGPEIDTVPDLALEHPITEAAPAGDVNNDGYDDFITGYPLSWSTLGEVNVLYGAPDADNVADIEITNGDWPGYQVEFGTCVAGLGDVNDDGVDDFAFSALMELEEYGTVWILTDTSLVTGVETPTDQPLPEGFLLSQNYPNPFNGTTAIRFTLPAACRVELAVYNIVGERVALLGAGWMSAGVHRVEWDGRSDRGEALSSGVYMYELRSGRTRESRKMLLLK